MNRVELALSQMVFNFGKSGRSGCPGPQITGLQCKASCRYCHGAKLVKACETCNACGILYGHVCHTCYGRGSVPDFSDIYGVDMYD
jgi:hypothetical protein